MAKSIPTNHSIINNVLSQYQWLFVFFIFTSSESWALLFSVDDCVVIFRLLGGMKDPIPAAASASCCEYASVSSAFNL